MAPFGSLTLRCWGYGGGGCIIRNNVYSNVFKTVWDGTYLGANITRAASFQVEVEATSTYACNRYEDGTFIEQQRISGDVTHVTTGCPSYP